MAAFDVLLPVKNGIAYLGEAIASIRRQQFRDWRLLVLDHGSTDGSRELALALAEQDSRIEVHCLPGAHGLAGLLNAGLDLCDCRYVLRQDADDISLPDRMTVLEAAWREDGHAAVIGSLGEVIDARGRRIGVIDMPTAPHGLAAAALFGTPVCHPAASMRLEALHRLGARYGEDFTGLLPPGERLQVPGLAEDYLLFGQLALLAPCRNLPDKLIRYRWHEANVGATRQLEQMHVALAISRHLARLMAAMHGGPAPDPAPFCTHGERLFDIRGRSDFRPDYLRLRALMERAVPEGEARRRELAFRRVLSLRSAPVMAARYLRFAAGHRVRQGEFRAVKSWLLRGISRRPMLTLSQENP